MISSKLQHLLAAAALAALTTCGVGCMAPVGDDTSVEQSSTGEELRRSKPAADEAPTEEDKDLPQPYFQKQVVRKAYSGGGGVVLGTVGPEEGPRPHPWKPTDTTETPSSDTNTSGGGTSGTSSH